MSYLLDLVRPTPGKDPAKSAKALLIQAGRQRGKARPADEQLKLRLVQALKEANPSLRIMNAAHADLSLPREGDESDRTSRPHIELYSDSGLTITVDDKTASVALPFWYKGDQIDAVLEETQGYLDILQREGKYEVYDPQMERMLNIPADLGYVRQALAQIASPLNVEVQVIRIE